jgi:hypothetical protein
MPDESLDNLQQLKALVDNFLGPIVTGIMIEQLLLGIICSQAVTYFRCHFSNDTSFCRSIVTCLVVSTAVLGILDLCVHWLPHHFLLMSKAHLLPFKSTALYHRLVRDFGDYDKFDLQDWILWAEPSLTAWIGFVAHIFYIFRCWAVTHSLAVCMLLGVGVSSVVRSYLLS